MVKVQDKAATAEITGSWGTLNLLSERAVLWPEQNAILVADLHLGKDATFQSGGISVPGGASEKTLTRLSQLVTTHRPDSLYILGDLFHARSSLSPRIVAAVENWIQRHETLSITLIRGNHDRYLGNLPAAWELRVVEPPLTIGGVMLTHFPQSPEDQAEFEDQAALVVSGHLHPAVRLGNAMDMPGKLACFWLSSRGCLTLPAFGEFVGTMKAAIEPGDQVWIPLGGSVLPVPANVIL